MSLAVSSADLNSLAPATNSDSVAPLLDFIGQHESGGDYNVVFGGGKSNLTGKTINQVLEFQDSLVADGAPSSAAGKYQIIRGTLRGLVQNLGLTGDELFDEAMQDKLATELLNGRGLKDLQANNIDTATFQQRLSAEFASLPADQSGRGVHDGDGLNKATADPRQLQAAIEQARGENATAPAPAVRRRLGINSDEIPRRQRRSLAITEEDFTNPKLRAHPAQRVSSQLGGTFSRATRRGFRQSKGLAGQLLRSIGDETGFAGAVELGDELIQEAFVEALRNPARIDGLDDVDSLGRAATFIAQTLGEQVFNIALAAAGAAIGAAVGTATGGTGLVGLGGLLSRAAVSKAALQGIAKRAAARGLRAKVGAAAGTFTAFFPINTGEILQEQRDHFENQKSSVRGVTEPALGPSLVLGAFSSALEVLGFGLVGKAIFGAAKKEVIDSVLHTVLRRVGHASLKSLAAEGGTEAVQEVMVIASKKINDPTFSIADAISSSEGLSRIAFAGVSGAVVGGILGGGGGVATGVSEAVKENIRRAHTNEVVAGLTNAIDSSVPSGQDEEVRSLLDIPLAGRQIVQLGKGAARSVGAALKAITLRLGEGTTGAAVTAAKQRYRIVARALGVERRALKHADEVLARNEVLATRGFEALEAIVTALPDTQDQASNTGDGSSVRKVGEEIRALIAELNKLDTGGRAARASELLQKARDLISQRARKPGSVAKGQIEQLISKAKAFVKASHAKSKRDSKKYHESLRFLRIRTAKAINRVRVADKELTTAEAAKLSPAEVEEALAVDEAERAGRFEDSGETTGDQLTIEEQAEDRAVTEAERAGRAEDSGTSLPTPTAEIVASVMQVMKARRDFAFAVGKTIASLPATVRKLIASGKLEAIETSKEVILSLPGAFKSVEDAKARSFVTQVEDIDPATAVVVSTGSKNEVTPVERLGEVVAIREAEGEQVTVNPEADMVITGLVEQLNEETIAAGAPTFSLTAREVEVLAAEDTEILVRTPTTTRLMHAFIDAEGNLRREDGGLFRLFDSLAEAVKGAKNKTTKHKIEGSELQYFVVKDQFGVDKYVVLSQLTDGRRQSAERQVRKAISRGLKNTKNKAKLAIAGVRSNGRKIWFHAGEVTALGLLLDAGSTQANQKGRYANPQTLFLDGLAYLMAQQDSNGKPLYTIDFRPTDVVVDGEVVSAARPGDANKAIYGTAAYKDAGPNQDKVIPRTKSGKLKDKGFVEWAIDKVLAGEISPTILRGLLWNHGFLSNEEIAEFDKMPAKEQERTILEGLALVQSIITGTEVESVTQGDFFRGGTKIATGGIQERSVRQPLQLEEDQDISEESLHLPSSEAQLVPISGQKKPDTSLPYAYADSLSDQALGYSQHAPHKNTGQLQNFITKWPAAQAAVEFTLKMLHIKEKVVLFDEDNASLLISIYKLEEFAAGNSTGRTALYRGYREQIERVLTDNTPGRIFSPPVNATGNDRFTHIFVSKNIINPAASRGTVLMHEVGHLVQYTHLDRLSPRLQAIVLNHMQGDTEAFANWMAKVAADLHFGRKVRATNEVDNIFVQIVLDLKKAWAHLRNSLKYPKGFAEFVAALNAYAATERGETVAVPTNPLTREIFYELQAQNDSSTVAILAVEDVIAPVSENLQKDSALKTYLLERLASNQTYVSDLIKDANTDTHAPRVKRTLAKIESVKAQVQKDTQLAREAGATAAEIKLAKQDKLPPEPKQKQLKPSPTLRDFMPQIVKDNVEDILHIVGRVFDFNRELNQTKDAKKKSELRKVIAQWKIHKRNAIKNLQGAFVSEATINKIIKAAGKAKLVGKDSELLAVLVPEPFDGTVLIGEEAKAHFRATELPKFLAQGLDAIGTLEAQIIEAQGEINQHKDDPVSTQAQINESTQRRNRVEALKRDQKQMIKVSKEAGVTDAEIKAALKSAKRNGFTVADFTIDGVVERSQDSFFGNWVDNAKKWAAVLRDDPIRAVSHLVRMADSELRSMGEVGPWIARQFRAMPGQNEDSRTVFRMVQMSAGPWHVELKRILDALPSARIGLAEGIFNRRPTAAMKAKREHRNKVTEALLLQTRSQDVSADIRADVEAIRSYFDSLYNWYTGSPAKTFKISGRRMKGMGMELTQRGFKKGQPSYYPLMVDTLFLDSNRKEFEAIFIKHGFSEKEAQRIRVKLTRDEDGGLNNGFQEDAGTDQFFGPGAAFKGARADWSLALRKDLVEAGFYHKDIATTMIAYTEMMVRRAVWQQRFQETDFGPGMAKRYKDVGIEDQMHSPVSKLLLKIGEARRSKDLNEWQYKRIINDILPAYAGQLGLRTNSKLRRISAGITIYNNIRLLPFAIFSQYVDVGTLIQRGDFKSFEAGLQGILNKATRDDVTTMLKVLGAIRDGVTEHALNDQALNTFMTGNAKRINDLFFRYNLMEGWTNKIRVMGAISGREFILRHAKLALDGNKTSQKYMNNLGLGEKENLKAAAAWDGFTTDNEIINAGLLRYVDEGMIRPDATIRPVHVSDPGYMIFDHLKGFLWNFHGTFIQPAIHEARVHQNLLPLFTLGMLALPFAAVGYELRRWVSTGGNPRPRPEGASYMVELFERGGLLGPWQLIADMEQADAFGKPFILGVAGPAAEQLFDFYNKDLATWLPKAIPLIAASPVTRDWMKDVLE